MQQRWLGSHVMKALQRTNTCNTVRFSFSKYYTVSEADTVLDVLKSLSNTCVVFLLWPLSRRIYPVFFQPSQLQICFFVTSILA